jgi:hypothetical protein
LAFAVQVWESDGLVTGMWREAGSYADGQGFGIKADDPNFEQKQKVRSFCGLSLHVASLKRS